MTTIDDKFEWHLPVTTDGITAIELISTHTQISKQKIKQAMNKGAVWLTQGKTTKRLRRATKALKNHQVLHIYYDAKILQTPPIEPQLIADEGDYSVWYKPRGLLSQGTKYGDHCTVYRWAETQLKPQRPAFIVHRLDKATNGLIIIAHSKKAAAQLSHMFSGRAINKFYKAIAHGQLAYQPPFSIEYKVDNKPAKTEILAIQYDSTHDLSVLDIQIHTGRKHQIRQHLAQLKHPVVGDRLFAQGYTDQRDLCLTAYKLMFLSPFDQQAKIYQLQPHLLPQV